MHIPDKCLDLTTAATMGAIAAAGLGVALREARVRLPAHKVPLLGLSAAFVFAAQMINFPVAPGTSGHLLGVVLVAALLGPAAAVIVISTVLIVQCFLFADGGITALGANVFNMALVGGVGGWTVYYIVSRTFKGFFGRIFAATFAAWASVVMASVACAAELAASGRAPLSLAVYTIAGVHCLIGLGEGIITAMVLVSIAKVRPDLLGLEAAEVDIHTPAAAALASGPPRFTERPGTLLALGLLVSLGVALLASPYACSWPDGLEKTAELLGFASQQTAPTAAPIPDYQMPGISSQALATSLAGGAGTLVAFGLSWLLARLLVPASPAAQRAE